MIAIAIAIAIDIYRDRNFSGGQCPPYSERAQSAGTETRTNELTAEH
jgi:hypothetical protein